MAQDYAAAVEKKFEILNNVDEDVEPDVDQLWENTKGAIKTAATESLGTSQRKAKKPWVSRRPLELMDVR